MIDRIGLVVVSPCDDTPNSDLCVAIIPARSDIVGYAAKEDQVRVLNRRIEGRRRGHASKGWTAKGDGPGGRYDREHFKPIEQRFSPSWISGA